MAGRHRGTLIPGFEVEEPAADESAEPEVAVRPGEGRRIALLVGVMLATVLVLGGFGVVLLGKAPDSGPKSAAQRAPRPTVAALPEQRTVPVVYPTRGVYVPPLPTAVRTTHKSLPKTATTTTTAPTTQPSIHQRPACPFQFPAFHDWCVRHGFKPPRG